MWRCEFAAGQRPIDLPGDRQSIRGSSGAVGIPPATSGLIGAQGAGESAIRLNGAGNDQGAIGRGETEMVAFDRQRRVGRRADHTIRQIASIASLSIKLHAAGRCREAACHGDDGKTVQGGESVTIATPRPRMPSSRAAARERSMIRSRVPGRSLMVTTTLRPLPTRVTRTRVPIGSVA